MAAAPKYLTGDAEGIKEFIDRFDVRTSASRHSLPQAHLLYDLVLNYFKIYLCCSDADPRSSYSTAMVCSPAQIHALSTAPNSGHLEQ